MVVAVVIDLGMVMFPISSLLKIIMELTILNSSKTLLPRTLLLLSMNQFKRLIMTISNNKMRMVWTIKILITLSQGGVLSHRCLLKSFLRKRRDWPPNRDSESQLLHNLKLVIHTIEVTLPPPVPPKSQALPTSLSPKRLCSSKSTCWWKKGDLKLVLMWHTPTTK